MRIYPISNNIKYGDNNIHKSIHYHVSYKSQNVFKITYPTTGNT